jgi:hypothetical protein
LPNVHCICLVGGHESSVSPIFLKQDVAVILVRARTGRAGARGGGASPGLSFEKPHQHPSTLGADRLA